MSVNYKCTSNGHGSMTYFTLFAAAFLGITVSHLRVVLQFSMLVSIKKDGQNERKERLPSV